MDKVDIVYTGGFPQWIIRIKLYMLYMLFISV